MRCKCGEMLTTYDMTRKTRIVLEDGRVIEVYEDLCPRCRSTTIDQGEEVVEDIDYGMEEQL